MTRTRKLLLSATAAIAVVAIAAPAAFASTTVEPAGEEVVGTSSNFRFNLTEEISFNCGVSEIGAEVPAEPENVAEEGPVDLSINSLSIWLCVAEVGGLKFPPSWGVGGGPWSLGAEVVTNEETEESQSFLNLRTGQIFVSVPSLGCSATLFAGDEIPGEFDNATSTVKFSGPATYDATKCGLSTTTGTFEATYKFKGLGIS